MRSVTEISTPLAIRWRAQRRCFRRDGWLRAYIVDLSGDSVAKMLVEEHDYYAFTTIPAGTYTTTAKDVTTFGVMATFDPAPVCLWRGLRGDTGGLREPRGLSLTAPCFCDA